MCQYGGALGGSEGRRRVRGCGVNENSRKMQTKVVREEKYEGEYQEEVDVRVETVPEEKN